MVFIRASFALSLILLPIVPANATMFNAIQDGLASHHAVYDIDLIATHSGSQVLNVSGQMTYEWKAMCEGYVTDHHFKLSYEYADSPSTRIQSDFSTFESKDGKSFDFTSRRKKEDALYQNILGEANMTSKNGRAVFSSPEKLSYDLSGGTLFPVGHTVELIKHAQNGDKFFNAQIFDGSDENGPIEINAFIGKNQSPPSSLLKIKDIDKDLLKSRSWDMRLAVFPSDGKEEESDYEMDMVFHENGIISDMTVDYDGFSVHQKLVSLKKIPSEICQK